MGFLSVLALLVSVAFLAHRYPDMLRNLIPSWLATSQQNDEISKPENDDETESFKVIPVQKNMESNTTEGGSTPKAKAAAPTTNVPTFTLSGNDSPEDIEDGAAEPSAPSFPALNSAQRASSMGPPPTLNLGSGTGLMLPPSRPVPAPRLAAAESLRTPTTGPLPNRGPPANSQQRVSNSLAPNAAVKTPNARGKVLLSPGHSPMDWAALTRKGNISGVSTFQRVTPSKLKQMTGRKGKPAWSSWQGKVYNITPYLPFHPGGEAELMKAAGRDGAKLFMDVHPWVNWENMLGTCLVGAMVPEDYGGSALEEMD